MRTHEVYSTCQDWVHGGSKTTIGSGPPMVLKVVHAGSVNTAKQRAHQAPSFCSAELLFAADPKVTLGALTNPRFSPCTQYWHIHKHIVTDTDITGCISI
jgi:hypothetical protein